MQAFDSSHLIKHIEYLVSQDETELAIRCFNMVPAHARDHRDKQLQKLMSEILSKMLMPVELMNDDRELPKSVDHSVNFLQSTARGQLLCEQVACANKSGIIPHLVDYGPGDFTFALALDYLGYEFTYTPISFHHKAIGKVSELLPHKIRSRDFISDNIWYVAYEIIEHLADTSEIKQVCDRMPSLPKKIFLSTPKYTYGDGTPGWRTEGIHHRRAYTPKEFAQEVIEMFPEYKFTFVDSEVMCLLGELGHE